MAEKTRDHTVQRYFCLECRKGYKLVCDIEVRTDLFLPGVLETYTTYGRCIQHEHQEKLDRERDDGRRHWHPELAK